MSEKNLATAVAYYQAMNNKDLSALEKYLHPEVRLIGPSGRYNRERIAVLNSVKQLLWLLQQAHDSCAIWCWGSSYASL